MVKEKQHSTTGEMLVTESGFTISKFAENIPLIGLNSVLSGFVGALLMASSIQSKNTEVKIAVNTKRTSKTGVDILLKNIHDSGDFPDEELADKVEKSEKAFRRDFRLRSA